ncbi:hypothetical protein SISSUDRAFT_1066680 [Sistotremastrum suecicum HHB10207 ss-3]|uniref:Uncharacterized protein n=1 Tax=Sistotremastrum suecicum HHB10207 ss-3 TaxID=1314776 RepID=A0A165Y155_9AGAM|nr:hypothetical protein SISSUDRAFT_1066680 [Sistotremastrum suecicum HHB10207 ss-3]
MRTNSEKVSDDALGYDLDAHLQGEELTDGKSECSSGDVVEWRLVLDAATRPKAFSVTLCGTAQSFAHLVVLRIAKPSI